MPLILLTTFLMPFCILASWESIGHRVKEYYVAFLVLETTMIGVFCALDLVLFYLFFEAGPLPVDGQRGVEGKRVDLGGRRMIKKKKKKVVYGKSVALGGQSIL